MFVVEAICRGLMKLMTSRLWLGVFTPAFWVCLSLRLPAKQVLPCLRQKQTLEPAAAKKRATHHPSALKLETSKSHAWQDGKGTFIHCIKTQRHFAK